MVAEAISAGIFNDLGSGSNVDVCIITKDNTEMLRNYETPVRYFSFRPLDPFFGSDISFRAFFSSAVSTSCSDLRTDLFMPILAQSPYPLGQSHTTLPSRNHSTSILLTLTSSAIPPILSSLPLPLWPPLPIPIVPFALRHLKTLHSQNERAHKDLSYKFPRGTTAWKKEDVRKFIVKEEKKSLVVPPLVPGDVPPVGGMDVDVTA
jgi:hypothetical protein